MGDGVEISEKENNKEEGEVMDTPERSKNCQIATSISKFEESPVFNFLNSLSPIKPVKSIHITQTINPLSFASLPSVFTSPHITSRRESRFLRRHQLSDPSKPEFSSDDQSTIDAKNVNMAATKQLDEQQENVDPRASDDDSAGEPSYDCSKFVVDFPEDYDCNSPNSSIRPSDGLKAKETALVPFVQEASQRGSYENEVNMEGISHIDQNKEATSCDWENLIDASNLLIFESPDNTNSYTKSIDHGTSFYTQSLCVVGPSEPVVEGSEPENLSTQPGEGSEMMENAEMCDIVSGPSMNNPGEKMDYEDLSGLYRGMRRRCLVFEMGGARRKHLDENSGSDSSVLLQSDGNTPSNDHKLVSIKTGNESSRRVLPGIGLHLNALAATPKDYNSVNHDSSAPRRLLIGPSSTVDFHPSTAGQELLLNNIIPVASSDRDIDRVENDVVPVEDACQASGFVANEETNIQSSPKKKRRRVEQAGDGETSCKRCNCKKSKCLKLYCECFAAGVYCVEPCACIDCFNKPVHEDTVLATRKQIESRNPLAFAPKVIRGSESISEIGDDSSKTPASARHKRGCNCKKCEGCKNAFGRKDGSVAIGMETEVEEDETDMTEKSMLDKSFQKCAIENDLEQNVDSNALPATPLRKKPPRSSFLSIGSSSGLNARQAFGKPGFLQPPPKFDKQFETVREDEMPEFLQEGSSPVSGIKLSSPNRKRVSPPRSIEMSPGLRSSRKLILQSIPSFPSLTPNQ
ncbi:hypothetical protein DH2020_036084 [Rehmannia glutinosa]|uniref:CRC domain-containing protein n=1 Tax=Rehmannia glutinosa TaxID=99300 RepID=A0ABR0V5M3_REHGL